MTRFMNFALMTPALLGLTLLALRAVGSSKAGMFLPDRISPDRLFWVAAIGQLLALVCFAILRLTTGWRPSRLCVWLNVVWTLYASLATVVGLAWMYKSRFGFPRVGY